MMESVWLNSGCWTAALEKSGEWHLHMDGCVVTVIIYIMAWYSWVFVVFSYSLWCDDLCLGKKNIFVLFYFCFLRRHKASKKLKLKKMKME